MVFGNTALWPVNFRRSQASLSEKQPHFDKPIRRAHQVCDLLFRQLRPALCLLKRTTKEKDAARQRTGSLGFLFSSLAQVISRLDNELSPNHHAWLRILVTGRPKALAPHVHQQLSLVAEEALRNALRHSQSPIVEVELEYLPRKLRLVIRDNGSGIHPPVLSSRNSRSGLRTMQERAQSIGANLRIWSKPESGTEVEITIRLASTPLAESTPDP